jgi:hypothetical protein
MRVHASLREDLRLWGSAAGGAIVLFGSIVLLGITPSSFPSLGLGRSPAHPAIVVAKATEVRGEIARDRSPQLHAAPPSHTTATRTGTSAGTRLLSVPDTHPGSQRPPSPSPPRRPPAPRPVPAVTSASIPDTPPTVTLPLPPLPSSADPVTPLLPLPTVTVPPLPDLRGAVPPLP